MELFEECQVISSLIDAGREQAARDKVIELLSRLERGANGYPEVVNHLIRSVGLFPYIHAPSAAWQDRFAVEAFKADVGAGKRAALHIEQSRLLSKLLDGESLAVSAPTSFGKSFVIDALIAIRKPARVLIIVPTIALMDETRRRLQKKFARTHRVLTATSDHMAEGQFIMVCPQERAISLADQIDELDLFVVDEFYKASSDFDPDRSAALVRAIVRFSSIARQKYFLAPNVERLAASPLTDGLEFVKLDFNTVLLKVSNHFESIGKDEKAKSERLRSILASAPGKTLVYAGTHAQVEAVASLLRLWRRGSKSELLKSFSAWLRTHYGAAWKLPELVALGVGVHNGQLHRPLSQIQVQLFDEEPSMEILVSTSSIIEGVNTSAENVVIWSAKNGSGRISDFDFRNIAGRSGRMFRHFVGNVFVLDEPPPAVETQLSLELPECLLGFADVDGASISAEQREHCDSFRGDLARVMPTADVRELLEGRSLQSSDTAQIRVIAQRIAANPKDFRALRFLLAEDPERWSIPLYRVIDLSSSPWGVPHNEIVSVVKVLSDNWTSTIPELLERLESVQVNVDKFFKLERLVSYRLASLISDINAIHGKIVPDRGFDISPFSARLSAAFLPPVVSALEEYGLPRMICRKIQGVGIIDFESKELTAETAIAQLKEHESNIRSWSTFGEFDRYLLKHFYEGVRGE